MKNIGTVFDIVFGDGIHNYLVAIAELDNRERLSQPRIMVVMDDVIKSHKELTAAGFDTFKL